MSYGPLQPLGTIHPAHHQAIACPPSQPRFRRGDGREPARNTQVQCNRPPGCSSPRAVPAVLEELREEAELPNMNLKYSGCKKEVPVRLVGFETISLILPAP